MSFECSATNSILSGTNSNRLSVAAVYSGSGTPSDTSGTNCSASNTCADETPTCPLCMEDLDETDKNFYPCPCDYQVCVWCYNYILSNMSRKCPACRQPYDETKCRQIPSKVTTVEVVRRGGPASHKASTKHASVPKDLPPLGGGHGNTGSSSAMNRKLCSMIVPTASGSQSHLKDIRVIQRNLVYILGLPSSLSCKEDLRKIEFFGRYGTISNIVVTRASTTPLVSTTGSYSVYVTFSSETEAADAIRDVDGVIYEGRHLRASFGTTKYCSFFLRGTKCLKTDCFYLHDLGLQQDSFTKEEMVSSNSLFTGISTVVSDSSIPIHQTMYRLQRSLLGSTHSCGNFFGRPISPSQLLEFKGSLQKIQHSTELPQTSKMSKSLSIDSQPIEDLLITSPKSISGEMNSVVNEDQTILLQDNSNDLSQEHRLHLVKESTTHQTLNKCLNSISTNQPNVWHRGSSTVLKVIQDKELNDDTNQINHPIEDLSIQQESQTVITQNLNSDHSITSQQDDTTCLKKDNIDQRCNHIISPAIISNQSTETTLYDQINSFSTHKLNIPQSNPSSMISSFDTIEANQLITLHEKNSLTHSLHDLLSNPLASQYLSHRSNQQAHQLTHPTNLPRSSDDVFHTSLQPTKKQTLTHYVQETVIPDVRHSTPVYSDLTSNVTKRHISLNPSHYSIEPSLPLLTTDQQKSTQQLDHHTRSSTPLQTINNSHQLHIQKSYSEGLEELDHYLKFQSIPAGNDHSNSFHNLSSTETNILHNDQYSLPLLSKRCTLNPGKLTHLQSINFNDIPLVHHPMEYIKELDTSTLLPTDKHILQHNYLLKNVQENPIQHSYEKSSQIPLLNSSHYSTMISQLKNQLPEQPQSTQRLSSFSSSSLSTNLFQSVEEKKNHLLDYYHRLQHHTDLSNGVPQETHIHPNNSQLNLSTNQHYSLFYQNKQNDDDTSHSRRSSTADRAELNYPNAWSVSYPNSTQNYSSPSINIPPLPQTKSMNYFSSDRNLQTSKKSYNAKYYHEYSKDSFTSNNDPRYYKHNEQIIHKEDIPYEHNAQHSQFNNLHHLKNGFFPNNQTFNYPSNNTGLNNNYHSHAINDDKKLGLELLRSILPNANITLTQTPQTLSTPYPLCLNKKRHTNLLATTMFHGPPPPNLHPLHEQESCSISGMIQKDEFRHTGGDTVQNNQENKNSSWPELNNVIKTDSQTHFPIGDNQCNMSTSSDTPDKVDHLDITTNRQSHKSFPSVIESLGPRHGGRKIEVQPKTQVTQKHFSHKRNTTKTRGFG